MKSELIIGIVIIIIFFVSTSYGAQLIDGEYIGWEKIQYQADPNKHEVWYHKNVLTIKNDTITINSSPVVIGEGKLLYSTSEGGFYNYQGEIYSKNENEFFAKIKVVSCDYCAVPVGNKWPENNYKINIVNDFVININLVTYIFVKK